MYPEFDLIIPETLHEAFVVLDEAANAGDKAHAEDTLPLAGGTNILVDIRARRSRPSHLIGLCKVLGSRRIDVKAGRVTMAAGATLSDVLRHPAMAECASSLVSSAKVFAGQTIRNTATVVGNVCYGSPAADTMPPLLVLDADAGLVSKAGRRRVALDRFFVGFRQSVRRADELVTDLSWPVPPPNSANLYYKVGHRKGDAISVVDIAVALTAEAGKCTGVRIALGAVAPVVMRARRAEAMLDGQDLTPALIEAAGREAMDECSPVDDLRASAEYRQHLVSVLTRRLLSQAWESVC